MKKPPKTFSGPVVLYLVASLGAFGFYTARAFSGYELGSPERQRIPDSVRQSPGGWRSFHFWHSGYHGGK